MMATVALVGWPVVALILFAALGPVRGLIWTTVAGYLFLPEIHSLDVPGLPSYNKYTAISLWALVGVLLFNRRETEDRIVGDRTFGILVVSLAVIIVTMPLITVLDNRFPIPTGPFDRKALGARDAVRMISDLLFALIPFLLAWRVLIAEKHHKDILIALVVAGIVYSFLALFEIRMSPQLNRWVYGFFPHSWLQHVRGGYRPLVFLEHGLWLGFFLFTATVSAFALARHSTGKSCIGVALAGVFIFGVLLISHNLGSVMLAIMFVPVVLVLSMRMQARIAMIVTVMFLAYPFLRSNDIVPVDRFADAVASVNYERARSFRYRMDNEDVLLERASQKPLFGWGIWARAQIFDDRGRMTSVTDGIWVIVLGERGWVGYLSFFGILTLPLLYLGRASRRKSVSPATAGLAIISAGNLIYMIPNATLSPINMLIFGALAGFVQYDIKTDQTVSEAQDGMRPATRYSRFAPGRGQARPALHRRISSRE